MYWRDEPVVGVDKAKLPQFTIIGHETNERKIKLATGGLVGLGREGGKKFTSKQPSNAQEGPLMSYPLQIFRTCQELRQRPIATLTHQFP